MSTDFASAPSRFQADPSHGALNAEFADNRTIRLWRDETGPSFADLLDALNPLQHIPVVSSIYRAVTGDEIGHAARVFGNTLFGGPVGMLVAGVTALIKEATGGEPGDHLVALVRDITSPDDEPTAVAGDEKPAAVPVAQAAETTTAGRAEAEPAPFVAFQARSPGRFRAAGGPSHTVRADDIERRRIAEAVLAAQRAQSHLLLSSLGLAAPGPAPDASESESTATPAHAGVAPAVSPDWLAQAMEQGLRKYEAARQNAAPAVDEVR